MSLSEFHGPPATPILESYWPDRLHQFVWRNWPVVDQQRQAEVLGATVENVKCIATSMGLGDQPAISTEQLRRSYITIIRRNWHVLPYEQLLQLLGWDEDQLAETLKEDDFLWIKLGCVKPRCEPLRYEPPSAAAVARVQQIRQTVLDHFGPTPDAAGRDPRFSFVDKLSRPVVYDRVTVSADNDPNSVRLDSDWHINYAGDAGPVVQAAGERLGNYLRAAFGIDLQTQGQKRIDLQVDAARFDRPESHKIAVDADGVNVVAADEQGLLRGLQHLQRQMHQRAAPLLTLGVTRRDTQFWPRFLYSYFALFGDPLTEIELDPFPDGYLERMSDLGVNGFWMHVLLRQLAPSHDFPEFGQGWQTRLDNLKRLVDKCSRYGIGIWLYQNEPRSMPSAFFDKHPDVRGVAVPSRGETTMCSSTDAVQRFLVESVEHVFSQVPDLAGAFTITASENLTNCAMTGEAVKQCPRCSQRDPAEVIAEVSTLIDQGVRRGSPTARTIVWDWGWSDDMAEKIINLLPDTVRLQSVSEWSIPITRGGTDSVIGEYSATVVGPGPRATRHWQFARQRGLSTTAKVQFNCTWEFSAAPYMPATANIAEHCQNLVNASVEGLQLGWSLGGHPSPNLAAAQQFFWADSATADEALHAVATERYGPDGCEQGLAAWRQAQQGLSQYPYAIGIVYLSPAQMGPANPLYDQPTGYNATMVGLPYDDVDRWRGPFAPEVLAQQFALVAEGLRKCGAQLEALCGAVDSRYRANVELDRDVVLAMHNTCASIANQTRFVLGRDALSKTQDRDERRSLIDQLAKLIRDELELAKAHHGLASADSRIGFEASNHYYYLPIELMEKVINCQWLESVWLAEHAGD